MASAHGHLNNEVMNNNRPPAPKFRKWLMRNNKSSLSGLIIIITVFTRLNAVAFWNFEQAGGDGVYSRAAFIITFLQYAPAVL